MSAWLAAVVAGGLLAASPARAVEAPEEAPRPAKPFQPPRLRPTASRYDSFGQGTTTARTSAFTAPAPKPAPAASTKPAPIRVPTAAEIGAQVKDEVKVPLTPFEWPDKAKETPSQAPPPRTLEKTVVIDASPIVREKKRPPLVFGFYGQNANPVGAVDEQGRPRKPYCGRGLGLAPGVSPKRCCKIGQWVFARKGCVNSRDDCAELSKDAECVPVAEPDPDYWDDPNFR